MPKVKRYTHSLNALEYNGVKASISEKGMVTITVEHKDDEFDEVTVPASVIYKLSSLLNLTQKVSWVEKDEVNA